MKKLLPIGLILTLFILSPLPGIASPGDSTITYDTLTHLMIVGAHINGSEEEFTFAIDTGAVTCLDKKVADDLGLKQQAMMAKIDQLDIQGFTIDKVFCFTTFDFSHFKALGVPIHGILGSNLFERYRVTIDFENRSVAFSSDTTALAAVEGGLLLPFRNHPVNNAPLVTFLAGDRSLEGMIDTGQPYPLVFPLETFEDIKDLCLPEYIRSDGLMEEWPMTTADHDYLARLGTMAFPEMKFDSVVCLFGQLPSVLSMPLIGTDFLSNFKVTINYPRDEILLVPNAGVRVPSNMFSAGLRPDFTEEGHAVVKGLWQTSPAAEAGLAVGDVIDSFDSRKTTRSNLIELIKMLDDDAVKSIPLGIARDDTTWTVTLPKMLLF
jgi:hypothetical protein